MSGFAVTPVAAFSTQNDEGFPDFLTWQQNGVNLGSDATVDTVNVTDGMTATRGTGETANVVTLTAEVTPFALSWRETDTDDTVGADDVDNAIAFTGDDDQILVVAPDVLTSGKAVLVTQEGDGGVEFSVPSGVTLLFRDDVFLPAIAGRGGIITLIGRDANTIILCGDMGAIVP